MSYNDTPHDEAESCSKNLLDELLAAHVLAFYLAETHQFIKTNDTRANESIPQTNTKGRTKARPEFLQSLTNGQSCSVGTHVFCPYYPFKSPSSCFGNAINSHETHAFERERCPFWERYYFPSTIVSMKNKVADWNDELLNSLLFRRSPFSVLPSA